MLPGSGTRQRLSTRVTPGTAAAISVTASEASGVSTSPVIVTTPALVIGEEWLVSGPRSLRDYRLVLKRYLADRAGTPIEHTVH